MTARLAVTVAGTVLGAIFPETIGIWGALAGSVIGAVAFPDQLPNAHGPRLDSLMVTSSAYGTAIPIVFGTFRLAGNIIWSKKLREIANTQTAGGKGGGTGGSSTTYTYRWSGGVSICESPAFRLLRIWADGKLVYDATGASPIMVKEALKFRVALGAEDQLPDSMYEADVGVGNAPAYRGQVVVWFDDILVTDYGNRVPNWNFELSTAGDVPDTTTVEGVIDLVGGPVGAPQVQFALPDWNRNRYFLFNSTGVRKYDITTRKEVQQSLATATLEPDSTFNMAFGGAQAIDERGNIFCSIGSTSNAMQIARIDGDSMVEISRVGTAGSGTDPNVDILAPSVMVVTRVAGLTYNSHFLISCSAIYNKAQIISADSPMALIGVVAIDESITFAVPGDAVDEVAVAYVLGLPSLGGLTPIGLYRVEIQSNGGFFDSATGVNAGVKVTKVGTISPYQIRHMDNEFVNVLNTVISAFDGAFFDHKSGRLYMKVTTHGGITSPSQTRLVRINVATAVVERVYPINVSFVTGYSMRFNNITDNRVAFIGNSNYGSNKSDIEVIDLDTGAYQVIPNWDCTLDVSGGGQAYNGATGEIVGVGNTSLVTGESSFILSSGRYVTVPDSLSNIVANLSRRSGLVDADFDVTELTDLVSGYSVNAQMTIRAAIEPLARAYKFDGVESDYIMKFFKRGRSNSLTITQEDLSIISAQDGDVVRETRVQEVDLPNRLSVVYPDIANDYQPNTQSSKRTSQPTPTMYTKNQSSLTIPVAMDADTAKRLSYTLLNLAWIERISTEFRVSWEYLKLDPVDSITVSLDNGTSYRVRLVSQDVGADFSVQFGASNETATAYTNSTLSGDSGDGVVSTLVPQTSYTRTFIWDSPLLRDSDDTGGTTSRMYCAGSNYGQAASWGSCLTTLGTTANPFLTDEVNTLTVMMSVGAVNLQSVTQLEMVNGANPAMIFNTATGVMEIIQYRDVTHNLDGSFTLSGLLRGRRGTDVYVSTHASAEVFIILAADPIDSFALALGELNQKRYYKGVQFGTLFEDAPLQTITAIGRPLMPYAPVSQKATINGSDVDITWQRRTRMSGDLLDGTGTVPLNETTESYEIDIWNGAGTAVLRTLTATTTLKKYLAANITTDFGSIPATLTLSIYQMSAAVGRGFVNKVTVAVA